MKLHHPFVLLTALALAACTSRSDTDTSSAALPAAARSRLAAPRALPLAPMTHRFGRLPDRGSLVVYPAAPVVRHDGAYTWYQAGISEAHARRAIGSGHLQLTTPSGERLAFRYERRVEHANGDWTWIGSITGNAAQEAIITFGEKAVFGSISQPGKEPLRLTIQNGASWLIETDPRRIAGINNVGTRPTEPDFVVAPDLAGKVVRGRTQAAGAVMASAGTPTVGTAAAAATAATTVDVALGYTPGFVSYYGGDSQAQTRLNNMVDITNEAYVNSQIDARIRLVRAVLVNYTDSNSNDTALQELTGFVAPSTRTTPAAAFSELRAARDTYGADLVSLVRRFNTPENEGCGIAWLIGGGRSGIDSGDAFFGYSVVSDGADADVDGKNYRCRDETLAHELAHNMGSAHDRDSSDGDDNVLQNDEYGAFDYSFGYKTTSTTGNFYTIMAYGDSGQTRYRVFSNPRVTTCGGLPCGVADQADNARSLNQTIPGVATFRASIAPTKLTRGDINHDLMADVVWRNGNAFSYWLMNGPAVVASAAFQMPVEYQPVASVDFNKDGNADVLWKSDASRFLILWASNGFAFEQREIGGFASALTFIGTGDFNGDGIADLLWRNTSASEIVVWLMNGDRLVRSYSAPMPSWFSIGAIGDFDGNGRDDVCYLSDARTNLYLSTATGFVGKDVGSRPLGWTVVAAADFNRDGRSDLVWRNPTSGTVSYWTLGSNFAVLSNPSFMYAPDRQLIYVGDYNGDGWPDMLWNQTTARELSLWLGNSVAGFDSVSVANYPSGWSPVVLR